MCIYILCLSPKTHRMACEKKNIHLSFLCFLCLFYVLIIPSFLHLPYINCSCSVLSRFTIGHPFARINPLYLHALIILCILKKRCFLLAISFGGVLSYQLFLFIFNFFIFTWHDNTHYFYSYCFTSYTGWCKRSATYIPQCNSK